ncbi:MAG: hypothetical protein LBE80_01030 [Deltaproteobacteria bacterium]|jgi:hypothetical protein|nr:hypothetical protein [Deltaproteobacteria bacterium]
MSNNRKFRPKHGTLKVKYNRYLKTQSRGQSLILEPNESKIQLKDQVEKLLQELSHDQALDQLSGLAPEQAPDNSRVQWPERLQAQSPSLRKAPAVQPESQVEAALEGDKFNRLVSKNGPKPKRPQPSNKAKSLRGKFISAPVKMIKGRLALAKKASQAQPPKNFKELLGHWEISQPEAPEILEPLTESQFTEESQEARPTREVPETLDGQVQSELRQVLLEALPRAEISDDLDSKNQTKLSENALRIMTIVANEIKLRAVIFVLVGLLSSAAMVYGGYLLPIFPVLAVSLVGLTTSLWRLCLLKNRLYVPFFVWLFSGLKAKGGQE